MLTVTQHGSAKYSPRTWANAKYAHLTMAFALDFSTRGEELTRTAAADRYGSCILKAPPEQAAEIMGNWRESRDPNKIINIAGNGMHTLTRYLWTQERANQWVYDVLKIMHAREPIEEVVSGGQTGIDMAAAVAAVALNIPAKVLLPLGFLQRDAGGHDVEHSPKEIQAQVAHGLEKLKVA